VRPTLSTDVLLVGGGVAAVRCARTLRREGFDGPVLLVGDEPTPPYNRPPLSKELLRDDLPDELVLAEPATWYARRRIERIGETRVEALDPDARTAWLSDGRTVGFERCLLATGAEPRRLTVPGGEHALLLRTLGEAHRLRSAAVAAGPGAVVTVVGGGFIGVEVASSLASLGLRPTIVELGASLWSGSLGSELAGWAAARLADAGVTVRFGTRLTGLDDDGASVGDERLPAAFTVAGIGVEPRTALAAGAGLAVADGIETDASHRASHAAVWAAGDVARRDGIRIEHWHAAREGGERAARSMLGLPIDEDPPPWFFSEVGGATLDVIGAADAWDEERWVADGLLAYLDAGRVVQLAAIDSAMAPDRMRALLAEGVDVRRLEAVVASS
jgi:3-phenylpropionate/trans-cinnamate dioxygenase ferredoxin reductase subunit